MFVLAYIHSPNQPLILSPVIQYDNNTFLLWNKMRKPLYLSVLYKCVFRKDGNHAHNMHNTILCLTPRATLTSLCAAKDTYSNRHPVCINTQYSYLMHKLRAIKLIKLQEVLYGCNTIRNTVINTIPCKQTKDRKENEMKWKKKRKENQQKGNEGKPTQWQLINEHDT